MQVSNYSTRLTSLELFLVNKHGLPHHSNGLELVDYVCKQGWWNEFLDYLDNKESSKNLRNA